MFKQFVKSFFIALLYSVIVSMVAYLTMRLFLMITASYYWYDKLLGSLLLFAEFFIIIQGIGYLTEVLRVFLRFKRPLEDREKLPDLKTNPYVSILIPSFHEPIEVVENTIVACYNMTYPNKQIFLLDDTRYDLKHHNKKLLQYKQDVEDLCAKFKINLFRRKWRGAKAGIVNDYMAFVQGKQNPHFKLMSFDENPEKTSQAKECPKYLIIFDADQNPFPNFAEPLVAFSEEDEKIGFIQTPQYYTNFEKNRIAHAAALQQVIFYEYICSGKSLEDVMLCCGSNALIRTEALIGIGGFDERSITEDFATTLDFHMQGWKTKFYSKVGAFGLGPEDLNSYFKQQFRWAAGAMDLFKKLIVNFLKHPKKLSFIKWWEYVLSTSFYFICWVYLILWICPIVYLLFGIPSFFASVLVYGVVFIPYLVLSMTMFYWSLRKRNYSMTDVFKGQMLMWVTFPVFMSASIKGLFKKKKKFEVTSKKGGSVYPFTKLLPQIVFSLLCFIAVIWGFNRLYYEKYNTLAIIINMIWTLYNFGVMSSLLYFNVSKKVMEKKTLVDL